MIIKSKTHGNITVLLDPEDEIKALEFTWRIRKMKYTSYVKRHVTSGSKHISQELHRFVLNITDPAIYVDHINHNGLDNRKSNLRICTNSQNQGNRIKSLNKNYSSIYKGVGKLKNGKWYAKLKYKGKYVYYKTFTEEVDAALAYNKILIEYFGEFAKINEVEIK